MNRFFLPLVAVFLAGTGCARGIDPGTNETGMVAPEGGMTTPDAMVSPEAAMQGECMVGEMRECYSGPDGTAGVGACRRGMQTCSEMGGGTWGSCAGETVPAVMETCGDMVDDDCNGTVDNGCGECTPMDTRMCYGGPSGTMGVGICAQGTQTCTSARAWGTCTGEVRPRSSDLCDNMMDDDCNGRVDDQCGSCMPGAMRACYTGAMGTMGVGICRGGMQSCSLLREWSATCTGQVTPMAMEVCNNMMDDNCNGMVDEGCGPACTAPMNATCATATTLTFPAMVSGDTTCSMNRGNSACRASTGNEVAYVFDSDGSPQLYTFLATGTTLSDPVLRIHGASACAAGDELFCNDDYSGLDPRIVMQPPVGRYYVLVDGAGTTERGTFQLSATRAAINNDTCSAPAPIAINGIYRGTTVGKANNYTGSCGSGSAPDVVYALRPSRSTRVTLSLCGSSFDTVLYVSTTCGSSSTACADDSLSCSSGTRSQLSFSATIDTTYYVVVDGFSGASGTYELEVTGL